MTRRVMLWLPLGVFALLVALVMVGLLKPNDTVIRSKLVGKPLPAIVLKPLVAGKPGVTGASFAKGKPRLLNVFASWCIPCIAEAPQLMRLKAMGVPIDAIAIRDTPVAVAGFLIDNGDPYVGVGDDPQSSVQLALGSSGVPETFVVGGDGRIVMQHIGPINDGDVAEIYAAWKGAK